MTHTRISYVVIGMIWTFFAYTMFTTEPTASTNKLNISPYVIVALRASIALLYLLIWSAGIFAWCRAREYAQTIAHTSEGPAFHAIANGLLVLISGLVAANVVGVVRSFNISNPDIVMPATIVVNYLYVLFPLAGFAFIYAGTQRLYQLLPKKILHMPQYVVGLFPVALLSVVYGLLIFTNPNRQIPSAYDIPASFYLSDVLIVATILIPVIIGWFLGVLSVMYITAYRKNTSNHVYKTVFVKFVYGIISIIASSVVLQVLLSLGSSRLSGVGIVVIIFLVFFFIGLQFAGYGLVAFGAKQLKQIKKN